MQASMDYGKAFTYPQQDAEWLKKYAILALVNAVPVLNFVAAGYTLEITRRVITENPQTLPEWTDFGDLFKRGFFAAVVAFIYLLPIFVFGACAYAPMMIGPMMISDSDTLSTVMAASSFIALCCGCLIFIYALAVGMILPAALGRLAVTGEIGAAFRVGEVIALVRAQPAIYLIIMLIGGLAASVLSSVGTIVCGIGFLFGLAYASLIQAHLTGQAYRAASGVSGNASAASPAN